MANNIGEVLDIELLDSYIKRPAGPMVTVEVKDISKLAWIIKIPSMTEGTNLGETTAQRISISGCRINVKIAKSLGTWPGHAHSIGPQHKEEASLLSLPLTGARK
jgi:hypothetical protein